MPFVPKEKLPDNLPNGETCPPQGAEQISGLYVRLVDGPTASNDCFSSFNAQGKENKRKVSPCTWAACSLVVWDEEWVDGPEARVRDFAIAAGVFKYKKYGAIISVNPHDGVGYRGSEESPHVSFWMSEDFDPEQSLVKIVSLA